MDAVEVLCKEGTVSARILGVGLHPFLIGQPFRAKYLARALERIKDNEDVWIATSDEIADWYLSSGHVTGRERTRLSP